MTDSIKKLSSDVEGVLRQLDYAALGLKPKRKTKYRKVGLKALGLSGRFDESHIDRGPDPSLFKNRP